MIIESIVNDIIEKIKWKIYFDNSSLLKNKEVIQWCFENPFTNKEKEREWGNEIIKKYCNSSNNICQWTTKLGEAIVKEFFKITGQSIQSIHIKNYRPDFQTNNEIIEVKTRSWNVSGTAGEKVLGVSKKYCEIPLLTNKPLKIICVAYQDFESHNKFNLFNPIPNTQLDKIINYEKDILNIHYISFTNLLKEFGFVNKCWDF